MKSANRETDLLCISGSVSPRAASVCEKIPHLPGWPRGPRRGAEVNRGGRAEGRRESGSCEVKVSFGVAHIHLPEPNLRVKRACGQAAEEAVILWQLHCRKLRLCLGMSVHIRINNADFLVTDIIGKVGTASDMSVCIKSSQAIKYVKLWKNEVRKCVKREAPCTSSAFWNNWSSNFTT